MMQSQSDSLLRDLRNGTLCTDLQIEPSIRRSLLARFRPHPRRAHELDALLERNGVLLPKDVWPHLALLAVWTGGSVAGYLPRLRELYGRVPVRDHGLSASEGRMTIPLEDETPVGVLDIGSHFFEFIPENEASSGNPVVLQAHELQSGGRYLILLTTTSGLYRYNIHDVVECTGFLGTTPLLKFLHKSAHISSITGEKLTELQVISAVACAAEKFAVSLEHYVLSPVWGDPPHYRLWLEIDLGDRTESFAEAVDRALQEENPEYAEKRQSGRIGQVRLRHVASGTWERFAQRRQSRPGGSPEQYKHPFLVPRLEFGSEIDGAQLQQDPT